MGFDARGCGTHMPPINAQKIKEANNMEWLWNCYVYQVQLDLDLC